MIVCRDDVSERVSAQKAKDEKLLWRKADNYTYRKCTLQTTKDSCARHGKHVLVAGSRCGVGT